MSFSGIRFFTDIHFNIRNKWNTINYIDSILRNNFAHEVVIERFVLYFTSVWRKKHVSVYSTRMQWRMSSFYPFIYAAAKQRLWIIKQKVNLIKSINDSLQSSVEICLETQLTRPINKVLFVYWAKCSSECDWIS